jgi:hypothetical protein
MIIEILLFSLLVMLDPFVGISLMVTVLSVASFNLPYRWLFVLAFGLGLINDLGAHHWLGLSSAILVTLCLIVYIIKEQFDIYGSLVVIATGISGELIFRLASQEPISLASLILQGVLVWLVWQITGFHRPKGGVYLRT